MQDNSYNTNTGQLFDSINFKSISDVRNLIDNLNLEQSLLFINKSLEYSYSKGVFSLIESEIVSKSLSILNSKLLIQNETGGERTDNN